MKLKSGTFLYDIEYNPVKLEDTAEIQEKWDGNYYLKTADKKNLNLGKHAVTYQTNTNQLDLYGTMYQIKTDGGVQKLTKNNKVFDYTKDNLYKLEDRKYLITSSKITNDTGKLNTKNYLLIIVDKGGNTLLLNNELNAKMIKKMIIQTPSFDFDIANEKLIYEDREIDLKKVFGSTNQYYDIPLNIEEEKEKEEDEDDKENEQTTIEQKTQINNNDSQITQQTMINGSMGSLGSDSNKDDSLNKAPLAKNVSLRSVIPSSSTLTVQYSILDPEDKYQTVYLELDGDTSRTIALDKNHTTYTITGLKENTDYKLTMISKEFDEEGNAIQNVEDIINVRTTKIGANINIYKITSKKIYFTFKMDPNYVFDSGVLNLYIDGSKVDSIEVDTEKASSVSGFNEAFKYDYGSEIIIKLENVVYNGQTINTDINAKIKNY